MRPKNASDIAISDSASIFRGTRSPIHNLEYALAGAARGVALIFGSPSTKRKSYCLTHDIEILAKGSVCSKAVAPGNSAPWCDQDGRRSANTAVAKVATSPPSCVISTDQCCVDRLALIRRTSRSNGPRATGAQKLTVSESGSPARCG